MPGTVWTAGAVCATAAWCHAAAQASASIRVVLGALLGLCILSSVADTAGGCSLARPPSADRLGRPGNDQRRAELTECRARTRGIAAHAIGRAHARRTQA